MTLVPTPPVLPLDLEREIFETCALSRPASIPKLILVAQRVKCWVEPLLYRTIALGDNLVLEGYPIYSWDSLCPVLESKPASFFHHAVRNLLWFATDSQKKVLMQCRGIKNLWIGGEAGSVFPLIEDLPLQQLYCSLAHLFGSERQIDFTHRLFSQLTHLELFDYRDSFDSTIWCSLTILPHLTHLAFNDPKSIAVWLSLLQKCHALRILILVTDGMSETQAAIKNHQDKELVKDPRFIMMRDRAPRDWYMGWYTGAIAGIDYWSEAEDRCAKRRSGEIDISLYWIDDDVEEEEEDYV